MASQTPPKCEKLKPWKPKCAHANVKVSSSLFCREDNLARVIARGVPLAEGIMTKIAVPTGRRSRAVFAAALAIRGHDTKVFITHAEVFALHPRST